MQKKKVNYIKGYDSWYIYCQLFILHYRLYIEVSNLENKEINFNHKPVLLEQCIEGLDIKPNGIYIDGTIGGAGHSIGILSKLSSNRSINRNR